MPKQDVMVAPKPTAQRVTVAGCCTFLEPVNG